MSFPYFKRLLLNRLEIGNRQKTICVWYLLFLMISTRKHTLQEAAKFAEKNLPLHDEPQCKCFQKDKLWGYLLHPSFYRLALAIIVLVLILGVVTGLLAGGAKIWMKTTILLSLGFSFFVVVSVPDHFLKQHIWDHIVKVHIPRIFLWTFGTLLAIHFLMNFENHYILIL